MVGDSVQQRAGWPWLLLGVATATVSGELAALWGLPSELSPHEGQMRMGAPESPQMLGSRNGTRRHVNVLGQLPH